jgi:hypothetical protein
MRVAVTVAGVIALTFANINDKARHRKVILLCANAMWTQDPATKNARDFNLATCNTGRVNEP